MFAAVDPPRASAKIFPVAMEKFAPLSILIVDDEPLIRWSMAETLSSDGYLVSEAGSADEALRELVSAPVPDIILLDFRLPDSNDLKLLETIRRLAPGTAVVMMTAYGAPDVVAGAIQPGAYRVVNKPVDLGDLPALVREAYAARPE